jgi:hypothetical protein
VGLNHEGELRWLVFSLRRALPLLFAASLTALVAPIDGARAASPTSNVVVVNPATEPALTRNVDDPGRIAYQSSSTCDLAGNTCNFIFPKVPTGHWLVV